LIGCVVVWIPTFSLLICFGDPDLYVLGLCFTVIGSVAFFFGLKSPLAAYLPLLINANHELVEIRQRLNHRRQIEGFSSDAVNIELSNHGFEDPRLHASTSTPVDGDHLIETGVLPSDEHEQEALMKLYHDRYEAIAGRTAITESASFIAGQLICLLPQFALLLIFADEDNPKQTIGERLAILVATFWAAGVNYLGLSRLKDRQGPQFPTGKIHLRNSIP